MCRAAASLTRKGNGAPCAGKRAQSTNPRPPVADVGYGEAAVGDVLQRIRQIDADQAIRLGIGQRPQQDAVDDAEDGGVGADAERDGQDGDDRKSGGVTNQSQRITNVLHERPQSAQRLNLAARFLRRLDAAD
jgi:hypothetical protein